MSLALAATNPLGVVEEREGMRRHRWLTAELSDSPKW
jgi:hypothetical protein